MTEEGRPWWNLSAVENATPQINRRLIRRTPSKPATVPVIRADIPVIKTEPANNHYPSYSANGKQDDYSIVKSEPLADIKSEPLAYLERALVKGEFPLDFSWPYMKWEPLPGASGESTYVKKEEKNYIPKPHTTNVFSRLDGRFNPFRRNDRPPPNWTYIYSRQVYEPTGPAKAWWNSNVERALKKRREAFLLTKQQDAAPIEVRMERLWNFEVAKDEARRVITESKWKAAAALDGIYKDDNGVSGEASSSAENFPKDNGSVRGDLSAHLKDRIGQLATVNEIETGVKENSDTPFKDRHRHPTSDEIKVLPVDKGAAEVYTIDDEIEDTMSNSDDGNITVIREGNSDVIFIEKKQGEVNIIAQVHGRVVKMNRKRKLCVTLLNNEKRNKVTNVDIEQSNMSDIEHSNKSDIEQSNMSDIELSNKSDSDDKDDDIFVISEQRKKIGFMSRVQPGFMSRVQPGFMSRVQPGFMNRVQPSKTSSSVTNQSDSPGKDAQNGVDENEKELIDINSEVESEKDILEVTDADVQVCNTDENVQMDSTSRSGEEEQDKGIEGENSVDSVNMLDVESSVNDKESSCSSINVIEDQMIDITVTDEDDTVVENTEGDNDSKITTEEDSNLDATLPYDDNVIEDAEQNDLLIVNQSEEEVTQVESDEQELHLDQTESVRDVTTDISVLEGDETVEGDEQESGLTESVKDVMVDISESVKDVTGDILVLESDDIDDSIQAVETEVEKRCSPVTDEGKSVDMRGEKDETELLKEKEEETCESKTQEESREPEEDILVISLGENEVEGLGDSDLSECSPHQKGDIVKDVRKGNKSSEEDVQMAGTCDEEIEILESNITTPARGRGRLRRFWRTPNNDNAPSNVGEQAKANVRQTRQSIIETRNARNTRSMPEKTFAVTGRQNLRKDDGNEEVKEDSSTNGNDDDKRESTLRGNRRALPQAPSSYSFRNRSKRC